MKKVLISLLVTAVNFLVAIVHAKPLDLTLPEDVHLNLSTSASTMINGKPSVNASGIGVTVGTSLDRRISDAMNLAFTDNSTSPISFTFTIRLSLAPALLKSYVTSQVKDQAAEIGTEKANEIKQEMVEPVKEQVRAQLTFQVSHDPKILALPPQYQEQAIKSTVNKLYPGYETIGLKIMNKKVNEELHKQLDAANLMIDRRMNKIELEFTFQAVYACAISNLGRPISGIAMVCAGKDQTEFGGPLDEAKRTYLESMVGLNLESNRVASTGGSGFVEGVYFFKPNSTTGVTVHIIGFNERQFFRDSNQYIEAVLNLPEAAFKKEQQYYDINSVKVRTLIQGKFGYFYVLGADMNTRKAYSFGGKINLVEDRLTFAFDMGGSTSPSGIAKDSAQTLRQGWDAAIVAKLVNKDGFIPNVYLSNGVKGWTRDALGDPSKQREAVQYFTALTADFCGGLDLFSTNIKATCSISATYVGDISYKDETNQPKERFDLLNQEGLGVSGQINLNY